MAFCICISLMTFLVDHSLAQKKKPPRSSTDDGYWYIKTPNPHKISQYMRDAGLLYLETAHDVYEAHEKFSISLNENDKASQEAEDKLLEMLKDRMNIHTQLPADNDFLSALIWTGDMAHLAGDVGICTRDNRPKEECQKEFDDYLSKYIFCKDWMKDSIDSGIFNDSWHEGCLGNYEEKHKKME